MDSNLHGFELFSLYRTGLLGISAPLFTGMFSAFEIMTEQTMDAIKMKESKIFVLAEKKPVNFFVIGRVKVKERDREVQRSLAKVRDLFVSDYGPTLEVWDGTTSLFDGFIEKIKVFVLEKQ